MGRKKKCTKEWHLLRRLSDHPTSARVLWLWAICWWGLILGSWEGRVDRKSVRGMMSESVFDLWVMFLFQPQKSFGQSCHFTSSHRVVFLHRFYFCDLNSRGYHSARLAKFPRPPSLPQPALIQPLAELSKAGPPGHAPGQKYYFVCFMATSPGPPFVLWPVPYTLQIWSHAAFPRCILRIPHWVCLGPGKQMSPWGDADTAKATVIHVQRQRLLFSDLDFVQLQACIKKNGYRY